MTKVLLQTIWDTGRFYREATATFAGKMVKGTQVIKARTLDVGLDDVVRVEFVDASRGLEGTYLTMAECVSTERELRHDVMVAYDMNTHKYDSALSDAIHNGEI